MTTRHIAFSLPIIFLGLLIHGNLKKNPMPDQPNQYDGPYVWYANGQVQVRYILLEDTNRVVRADSATEAIKASLSLRVATENPGEFFAVSLKSKINKEKSEYKKVNRQFVVSDIEGSFGSFRKILQAGGVIDDKFNWTFGDGHLVLIGDFVDRGSQVTEVLWLIYSLEEKAKAAGGYVHFVLGNHEIMIMSGDTRYVNQKYGHTTTLLNRSYVSLFDDNTELGRWLRSKNIVEKVGSMLYAHGGMSEYFNMLDLSLAKINELAQPHYADSSSSYKDPLVELIYLDNGPFWYRGYYNVRGVKRATMAQVDSTRDKFRVDHVVTGHTLVTDSISTWYDGKVINTDVHHAQGRSEGMLIDGGQFFRIKITGEKIPLNVKKP